MNTSNPAGSNQQVLEQKLQAKLTEYSVAEHEGKSHDELNAIYKEIKDLRYRLTILTRQPLTNDSSYNLSFR